MHALVPSLMLSGCGNTQELEAQNATLQAQVAELTATRDRLEREADGLQAKVRRLEGDVERYRTREVLLRLGVDEDDELMAQLHTSKGLIECRLWPEKAPLTVLNFVQLAEGSKEWTDPRTRRKTTQPLYDGTLFHRVIPRFMIQTGDPLGNGSGGPGYKFEDEIAPGTAFDTPGLLAMANSGPDTNGSQFFVTDRSTPHHLDGKHTIFGQCANLDVVEAIASSPTGARDKPEQDVVLERVRIVRRKAPKPETP